MNKYLKAYYDVSKKLAKEFEEQEYSILSKLQISAEIENILDWGEFENIVITDKHQERLVDIIYDIYIDSDNDLGVFAPTKAVMETILDYGSYEKFINNFEKHNAKAYDEIIWKMDY